MRSRRRNFVEVSRGLAQVRPDEVDTRQLGPHWTTEPEVAWNFAMSRDFDGSAWESDDNAPLHGTLVHGLVHKRHIIQPGTDEFEDWSGGEGVFGPNGPEREQTVRPGAPVWIQSMNWASDDESARPIHIQHKQFFRGRA
ncbi:MAG: hypothetical protein EBR40_10390 [Proteobacteria bacterium]|nr:hypothetical protein [Pseudomonadota bacterium]